MHAHALIFTGLLRRIRRIRKGNIESLYSLVASLQGSHAGQNIFKISGIFKFERLAVTDPHIKTDVETTAECSPII